MRILLAFIFLSYSLFSQQSQIDSLRKSLSSNLSDTSRGNTLCLLAWELGNENAKEGLETGKKALAFSREKKLKKIEAHALNTIAYNYNMLGQLKEAVQVYLSSIEIWHSLEDTLRIAKAYSNIGNVYSEVPQFDSAQKYYLQSIDLCKKHKYRKPLSSACLNLASLYISKNWFSEGIRLLLEALKIKEEISDKVGIANVCHNISVVYKEQKKYQSALQYELKSIHIWKELNNLNGLSYSNMGLGLIYYRLSRYDSALFYTYAALENFEKVDNKIGIATGYDHLGLIYDASNLTDKAIVNFEKAKESSMNPFITESYVSAGVNLVTLYSKSKKLELAKMNLDTVLKYVHSDIQKNIVKSIYKAAADYYFAVNDFRTALRYNELYNNIKDSLVISENFAITSELQLKYETDKKESENQKLKYENQLRQTELLNSNKRRQQIVLFFIFLLLSLGAVVYLIYRSNKSRQELKHQEMVANAAFETEQQERARIARELHDGIGQKLSVAKMRLTQSNVNPMEVAELVDQSINELRSLSHNLMPDDLSRGIVVAIENLKEQINASNSKTKVNLSISEEFKNLIFTRKTELYLYRIVQEIASNTLKYANATKLNINMDYTADYISLNLSDDGIGFNSTTQGEGDGIGLKNIRSRIEQLQGNCTQKSTINQGTSYIITIPNARTN